MRRSHRKDRVAAGVAFLSIIGLQAAVQAAAATRPLQIEDAALAKHFQVQGAAPTFSPDGQWVSSTVCDPKKVVVEEGGDNLIATQGGAYRSMGCDIWLSSIADGTVRNITEKQGNNWGPSWSPDGKRVAFYSDRDGRAGLWLWESGGGTARKVMAEKTRHLLGLEIAQWTPDGRYLVVKLLPEGAVDASPKGYIGADSVDDDNEPGSTVVVFQSPRREPEKDTRKPLADKPSVADLGLVDVATGTVKRIATGLDGAFYKLSPDGRYLFALVHRPGDANAGKELTLVELATGTARSLANGIVQSFTGAATWSPDSRRIAYASIDVQARKASVASSSSTTLGKEGADLFIVDVQGGAPLRIEGAPTNTFMADYRGPLWDAQGKHLYVLSAADEVWNVDATTRHARRLTQPSARHYRLLVSTVAGHLIGSPDGRSMYASFRNEDNRKEGFSRIDLETGQATAIMEEDNDYGGLFSAPVLAPAGRELLYSAESSSTPTDLWLLDLRSRGAASRRLTAINPELDKYRFGRSQVIDFASGDGKPLQATVLLPADYKPGTRYPTILWVYAGDTDATHYANTFGLVGTEAFNMQMLTTRGYAVMWPEIPTHKGTPMKDLMKAVMPAIDRLVDLGIADPERLAVMGQSNGGYSALALITQTTRFKAAVMSAGFGDLTAFYGTMGGGSIRMLEGSIGSMQVPPWEAPLRYVENSPVYYLDRVETPLIIQAGAADTGIINHSDAVWVGLQRLNKNVTYLRYGGEGHVLASASNLRDYWRRVLAFFDEHLAAR